MQTTFVALHLRGLPFFKRASIPLNKHALTFVLGMNRNTKGGTNAAGKSLLLSQIPELIFGSPIVGTRKDRLLNGTVALDLLRGSTRYRVIRKMTKGKETLRVERNGKDLVYRTINDARQFVQTLVGCRTREEFETRMYLDVLSPHPLIRGDTGARKDFFTSFFNLNSYDQMRALLNKELREVEKSRAQIAVVDANIKELRARYLELKRSVEKIDLDGLREEQSTLDDKIKRSQRVVRIMEQAAYINQPVVIARLKKLCGATLTQDAFDAALDKQVQLQKKHQKAREAHEAAQDLTTRINVLKEQIVALRKASPWLRDGEAPESVTVSPETQERLDNLLRLQGTAEEEVNAIRRRLNKVDTPPEVCTECGQPWPAHSRNEALKERAVLKAKLEKARTHVQAVQEKIKRARLKLEAEQLEERQSQKLLDIFAEHAAKCARLKQLQKRLGPSVEWNAEAAEITDKRVTFLKRYEEQYPALLKVRSLSKLDQRLASESAQHHERHVEVASRLTSALHQHETLREALRDLKKAKRQREELSAHTAEAENLAVLAEAYSKKGVPDLLIRALASRLEDTVNRYSSYLFPEGYQFTFQLDTQFSILVTRTLDGANITSDVRKLSGAESRLFSVLLLLSLITFVPENKRSNLLILDEPDASMGEDNIELLYRFIDMMNKVIPNIIVITPRPHNISERAAIYTVVKDGKESTLHQGVVTYVPDRPALKAPSRQARRRTPTKTTKRRTK